MALTESEKNELKKDILNSIKSESQSVDELAEVTSLDNIKSLPAMRGQEVVLAPVALLRKPAEDAAAVANAAATKADNAATGAANAAQTATNAAGTANRSAETANAAAGTATAAAKKAEDAAAAVDGSLVGSMTAVPDEKNDTVKLTILGRNGQAITSTDIPGGTGSGGNTYNVTEEVPLENGDGHHRRKCEIPVQGPLHHLRGRAGQMGDETVHRHERGELGTGRELGGFRRGRHDEEPDGERREANPRCGGQREPDHR